MVSEKRKAYQRDWIRRKRAKQKIMEQQKIVSDTPIMDNVMLSENPFLPEPSVPEQRSGDEKPKINVALERGLSIIQPSMQLCRVCSSPNIIVKGTKVICRNCHYVDDYSKFTTENKWEEGEVI